MPLAELKLYDVNFFNHIRPVETLGAVEGEVLGNAGTQAFNSSLANPAIFKEDGVTAYATTISPQSFMMQDSGSELFILDDGQGNLVGGQVDISQPHTIDYATGAVVFTLKNPSVGDLFVRYDRQRPINAVFASPERAFARLSQLYGRDRDYCDNRIFLPAMSIMRMDSIPAPDRYNYHNRVIIKRYPENDPTPEMNYRDAMFSESPQPFDLLYMVDFWAKTRNTLNDLVNQVKLRFRNNIDYMTVNFPFRGEKFIGMRVDSIGDASDLEPGDKDRMLRATMSFTVFGMFHRPLKTVRTVLDTEVKWYDVVENQEILLATTEYIHYP